MIESHAPQYVKEFKICGAYACKKADDSVIGKYVELRANGASELTVQQVLICVGLLKARTTKDVQIGKAFRLGVYYER